MTYTQKYTLVSFKQPIGAHYEFDMADWPLHVTLADVFAIDRAGSELEAKLTEVLVQTKSVTVTAAKDAILGTTEVVILHGSDELLALHNRIIDVLTSNGVVFNVPEFTRAGFLPHCTVQKTGRLHEGDQLTIDTVTLIDMFPNGDWQRRRVLDTFGLLSA